MLSLLHLAGLILGLAAWILPIVGYCIKRSLAALSWCCCALAMWFPIYITALYAEHEFISSFLDCSNAYDLLSRVLLIGTALINIVIYGVRRAKKTV